ncbi:hypothetical protein ACXYMU_08195 [Pontibacter sp. CAU 1760]
MKRIALLFPVIFVSQVAFGQTPTITGFDAQQNILELGDSPNATSVRLYDNRYEGVKGTPYFYEDWAEATITSKNTIYKDIQVKFNVVENELFYRNAAGKEFILKPQYVDNFTLKGQTVVQPVTFKKFEALAAEDLKLASTFVIPIYDGKQVQLVKLPQKLLVKANFEGPYKSGNTYDEFRDEQVYYLIGPGKGVSKVKLNKRALLKALPGNQQDKLENYIKARQLDVNAEAGWAKVLAYYESLH